MVPTSFKEEEFNGDLYTCVASSYQDTISINVYKNSKICKMFKCQLYPLIGGTFKENNGLISSVNPEPLLGNNVDEVAGNLYTETIASMILKQAPHENRVLVLGLGNIGPKPENITAKHKEELLHVIKLVQEARVW